MVTLQEMAPIAIAFVIVAIILGIGADVLSGIQDDQTTSSYSYNASDQGLEAIDKLADWLPTIGLVVAAAVVIGVIVAYFKFD